jgi:hypothetical protein
MFCRVLLHAACNSRAVQAYHQERRTSLHSLVRMSAVWLSLCAVSFALSACGTIPIPTPTATPQVVTTRLTALAIGKLNLLDHCVRVNDYSLAFPPEFSVTIENDRIKIDDSLSGDRVIWRVGETIQIGGGEVPYQDLTEPVRQRLSSTCHSPYWLVGGVVIHAIATPTAP